MPRPKKPTPREAQRIFNDRIEQILERYKKTLAAAKGHPTLVTYWRSGYPVRAHRVTGHWVVRAKRGRTK